MKENIIDFKDVPMWFGHEKKVNEKTLARQVYKDSVREQIGKVRCTYHDQIENVLKKGQVKQ